MTCGLVCFRPQLSLVAVDAFDLFRMADAGGAVVVLLAPERALPMPEQLAAALRGSTPLDEF